MLERAFRLLLVVAAVACAGKCGTTQAQYMGTPFFLYNYGGGGGFGGYGAYTGDRIPYYSLFPPVYYKHPVPRTYGYSPFAYPPGYITPSPTPVAQLLMNPYCVEPNGTAPAPREVAENARRPSPPKLIENPFVK